MQALIETTMAEAVKMEREQWAQAEGVIWDQIKSFGVTVDEVEKEGFRKAVEPFVEKETAKFDKDWVTKVMQAAG